MKLELGYSKPLQNKELEARSSLMESMQAGSLAANICQPRAEGQPLTLKLELGHREPLQGKELDAYYASQAAHALEEDEPQPLLSPRQGSHALLSLLPACGTAYVVACDRGLRTADGTHTLILLLIAAGSK